MFTSNFLKKSAKPATDPALELAKQGLRAFVASMHQKATRRVERAQNIKDQLVTANQYVIDGDRQIISAYRIRNETRRRMADPVNNIVMPFLITPLLDMFMQDKSPDEKAAIRDAIRQAEPEMRQQMAAQMPPQEEPDPNEPTVEDAERTLQAHQAEFNVIIAEVDDIIAKYTLLLATVEAAQFIANNATNKTQIDNILAQIADANAAARAAVIAGLEDKMSQLHEDVLQSVPRNRLATG